MRDTDQSEYEIEEVAVTDQDIRRMALGYIDEAFAEAVACGIDSAAVSHAALFTAFADLAYPGSIYHAMTGEQVFVILITIVMTTVLLLGLIQRERHGLANIGFESVLLLLLYCGGMALLLGGAVTGG